MTGVLYIIPCITHTHRLLLTNDIKVFNNALLIYNLLILTMTSPGLPSNDCNLFSPLGNYISAISPLGGMGCLPQL